MVLVVTICVCGLALGEGARLHVVAVFWWAWLRLEEWHSRSVWLLYVAAARLGGPLLVRFEYVGCGKSWGGCGWSC